MKHFTIGPVQMSQRVSRAGGVQVEYFRDKAFADRVVEAQARLLALLSAPSGSELAILSSSGTGAMEAAITNFTRPGECVVAINGGSFGKRFAEIARFYGRAVHVFEAGLGQDIDFEVFRAFLAATRPAVVLVNAHETSTGQSYNLAKIASIARGVGAFVICDAVSAVACDPFDMSEMGVDVTVFSANKGLGLAPGAGFVAATPLALERLQCTESYYFDLGPYFAGGKRGQPPFTSAVAVIMQLLERLDEIEELGGIETITQKVAQRAQVFRSALLEIGIRQFPQTPSNAITAFVVPSGASERLYEALKEDHGFIINKSAHGLGVDVPRVAHVGDLTVEDHLALVAAMKKYF